MPKSGERRACYRLRYPVSARPVAYTGNRLYDVAELSETGVRLVFGGAGPAVGAAVSGYIRFHDGRATRFQGVVLRHEGGEAVLRLAVGVDLARMLAEQRHLLRIYPTMYDLPHTDPV